jgi:hypothetical protein
MKNFKKFYKIDTWSPSSSAVDVVVVVVDVIRGLSHVDVGDEETSAELAARQAAAAIERSAEAISN